MRATPPTGDSTIKSALDFAGFLSTVLAKGIIDSNEQLQLVDYKEVFLCMECKFAFFFVDRSFFSTCARDLAA